jgi:hypothetical protein
MTQSTDIVKALIAQAEFHEAKAKEFREHAERVKKSLSEVYQANIPTLPLEEDLYRDTFSLAIAKIISTHFDCPKLAKDLNVYYNSHSSKQYAATEFATRLSQLVKAGYVYKIVHEDKVYYADQSMVYKDGSLQKEYAKKFKESLL